MWDHWAYARYIWIKVYIKSYDINNIVSTLIQAIKQDSTRRVQWGQSFIDSTHVFGDSILAKDTICVRRISPPLLLIYISCHERCLLIFGNFTVEDIEVLCRVNLVYYQKQTKPLVFIIRFFFSSFVHRFIISVWWSMCFN